MTYDPTSSYLEPAAPGGVAVGGIGQSRRHKRRYDAVLTLEDPRAKAGHRLRFIKNPHPHRVLLCEDVDTDALGVLAPTAVQVQDGLDFARQHAQGSLLVHCHAGVARSTAMALSILADRLGPGAEPEALQALLRIRPCACPNRLIVGHADTLLGRNGALVAALDAWEAATPAIYALRQRRLAHVRRHLPLYAKVSV